MESARWLDTSSSSSFLWPSIVRWHQGCPPSLASSTAFRSELMIVSKPAVAAIGCAVGDFDSSSDTGSSSEQQWWPGIV